MNFWAAFTGMLEIEVTSADPGQMLQVINRLEIPLYCVNCPEELTVKMKIHRSDLKRIGKECEKRGDTLKICRKIGLYWFLSNLLRRPVLITGLAGLLFLMTYLPSRVLFIRVEGNSKVPSRQIVEAAENCGIRFGASRRAVRSEKMKNELLERIPKLQWAGVNTSGCTAVILVREREEPEISVSDRGLTSVVAARDGVITSCVVTKGNGLCSVGQAVKQGQILISPYTDCGISIRVTEAEGEIFAETIRKIHAVTPSEYKLQQTAGKPRHSYSLVFGKKRINLLKDSGICTDTCDRMYEEYYITLPGGFQLPVRLVVETVIPWELGMLQQEVQPAVHSLENYVREYIHGQMISSEILEEALVYRRESGRISTEGSVVCREMIGRELSHKIGETNG